jgi:hypothetical protein
VPVLCVCFNFGFGARGQRGNQPSSDGTVFCNNRNQKVNSQNANKLEPGVLLQVARFRANFSSKLEAGVLLQVARFRANLSPYISDNKEISGQALLCANAEVEDAISQWLAPKCCLIYSVNSTEAICLGTLESLGRPRYTARGEPGASRLVICARAVDEGRPDMHWHRLWQHIVLTLFVHRARKASRG